MSQTSGDGKGYGRGGLPSLGVCRLGLLDGLGELKLVRTSGGAVLRGSGVWQPTEELGYDDLRELFRPGALLLYQGPASDDTAGEDSWHEVRLEVEVTSVERCGPGDLDFDPRASLIRLQISGEDQVDRGPS